MLETLATVFLWVLAIIGGIAASPFIFVLLIVLAMLAFILILILCFATFIIGATLVRLVTLPFEKLGEYFRARKRLRK